VTRTCGLRLAIFGLARWTRLGNARHHVLLLALLLALWASPAQSHDPSAWGGLFRSRDYGATWVSANRGQFLSGAIALAISPTDVNHLLLGAESGLLRSRNGGRDWTIEAPSVVLGSVVALAFAADGQRALISTGQGVFRGEAENSWRPVPAPQGAAPARAMVRGSGAGRVYLAGRAGLYRSDDWGVSWSSAADGLPQETATALVVVQSTRETLYAIVQDRIWASIDGARSWASRGAGISPTNVDALAIDPTQPTRLWAAGGDRVFRSSDGGASWQRIGQPLPEANTSVHGITASDEIIVVATDRGLYRSVDGGESWTPIVDNLPAHLEAGPLVRDPVDPASFYAGFSLIPYTELWRRAADREGALARVSIASLLGGLVFLVLVALGALGALRLLGTYYRPAARSGPTARTAADHRMEGNTLP
jgi:photosystem II stability/assembly factor-like uncharacterized protein